MKPVANIAMILTLAACGPADNDPGPGGVTVGEARALDDAAQMLESRRLPPQEIVTGPGGGPGAGPSGGPERTQ